MIINNTPVSANFNILCPTKKFIHFVVNKFDKNSDVYGFGFADAEEMKLVDKIPLLICTICDMNEMVIHFVLQLYDQLGRIRSSAMASLTPSFHHNASSFFLHF